MNKKTQHGASTGQSDNKGKVVHLLRSQPREKNLHIGDQVIITHNGRPIFSATLVGGSAARPARKQ